MDAVSVKESFQGTNGESIELRVAMECSAADRHEASDNATTRPGPTIYFLHYPQGQCLCSYRLWTYRASNLSNDAPGRCI
jgi:hypothetical protein